MLASCENVILGEMLCFVAVGQKPGPPKKTDLSSKNAPFLGENANLTNGACFARPPPPPHLTEHEQRVRAQVSTVFTRHCH